MKKYSPKEAIGMTFGESGPVPAQGQIAQQIFWYTAFTADMTKPGLPVVNADGTPKWRIAPGPNGPYGKQGMQNGYQDVGSWTFFASHDANRTAAAWLYAQFVTAKTTSLKKTIVGLTPIRESDIQSQAMTDLAPKLGGLVEFYRSPARVAWTPTGANVPDYPKLAQLWWKNVAVAVTGEKTPQAAMRTVRPAASLSVGWTARPEGKVSVDVGDAWLAVGASALIELPSVIVSEESNVLINPKRADAVRLKSWKVRPWFFDARLKR